jgi:benzoate/toluate 1,2-dioxygenase beta subunit
MDEHRYREWLSLWTDDAVYWVPCSDGASDPKREVAIIYDDRRMLSDRVAYLEHGTLDAETRPRLRRVISNVEVGTVTGSEVEVESNFVLLEARDGRQYLWGGRSSHRLCQDGSEIKIRFKRVQLVNSGEPLPIMNFLV